MLMKVLRPNWHCIQLNKLTLWAALLIMVITTVLTRRIKLFPTDTVDLESFFTWFSKKLWVTWRFSGIVFHLWKTINFGGNCQIAGHFDRKNFLRSNSETRGSIGQVLVFQAPKPQILCVFTNNNLIVKNDSRYTVFSSTWKIWQRVMRNLCAPQWRKFGPSIWSPLAIGVRCHFLLTGLSALSWRRFMMKPPSMTWCTFLIMIRFVFGMIICSKFFILDVWSAQRHAQSYGPVWLR